MSFKVDPVAIGECADALRISYDDEMAAKNYILAAGQFNFHETGAIGMLSGDHAALMAKLEEMLGHLLTVNFRSEEALRKVMASYFTTDKAAAARVDATYPAVPRAPINRD